MKHNLIKAFKDAVKYSDSFIGAVECARVKNMIESRG